MLPSRDMVFKGCRTMMLPDTCDRDEVFKGLSQNIWTVMLPDRDKMFK